LIPAFTAPLSSSKIGSLFLDLIDLLFDVVISQGRDGPGLESTNAIDVTDQISTIGKYFQRLPKIGLKSQIDTLSLKDQLLSSQTTDHDPLRALTAAWNFHHVNKRFA
jgi:hypothetical protein